MTHVSFVASYLKSLNEEGWHIKEVESIDAMNWDFDRDARGVSYPRPPYRFKVAMSVQRTSRDPTFWHMTPTTSESESAISRLYDKERDLIDEEARMKRAQRQKDEGEKAEREITKLRQITGMKVTRDEDGGYNFD